MSRPQRNGLQLWRLAANILNKQPWTNDKGWSSRLAVGLTTLQRKNKLAEEEDNVVQEESGW
jgi:hypothetical protein